jgi:tetratricopeptide (TPR) repeat protein
MSSFRRGTEWSLAVLLAVGGARADTPPTVWDIAKEPAKRHAYELHIRVDRLLHPSSDGAELGLDVERMRELRLDAARVVLEDGMREVGDASPRLRVDLGVVVEALATIQQRPEWHRRVVDLLAPLADEPYGFDGDPAPLEALATAYAWLNRAREEVPIWRRYVDAVTDDRRRVSPLVNLGEAEMRLGDLTEAVSEFRRAMEICEELAGAASLDEEYALALWDLSVALDRGGDTAVALGIVRRAKRWTWLEEGPLGLPRTVTGWDVIRDHVDVYFVPAWEREWYLAMGEAADAEATPDTVAGARMWAAAEQHWKAFLAGAEADGTDKTARTETGKLACRPPQSTGCSAKSPGGGELLSDVESRWVAMARLRLAHAHAKRMEAERRSSHLRSLETSPRRAQAGP